MRQKPYNKRPDPFRDSIEPVPWIVYGNIKRAGGGVDGAAEGFFKFGDTGPGVI